MTTLAPPDVEAAFVTYLNAALTQPVSTRIPSPRPAEHVRVQVVGGVVPNVALDAPRLLVECWAATSTTAAALARTAWVLVSESVGSTPGGVHVHAANLSHPVGFPDPDTTSPRYQFTADLVVVMTPAP